MNILLKLYWLNKPMIKKEMESKVGYKGEDNYATSIIRDLIAQGYIIKNGKTLDSNNIERDTYVIDKKRLLELLKSCETMQLWYLIIRNEAEVLLPDLYDKDEINYIKNSLDLNSYEVY